MIIKINSLTNDKIKKFYKQTRDAKSHYFVIESVNVILEQINTLDDEDTIITTELFFDNNKWVEKHNNIIITNVNIINKISFTKSPPECILIKKIKIPNFEIKSNQNYIILDNITDPGNLATIIRTSIAFDIFNFFISNNSVSVFNDKVLRSTMGSIFLAKINYYDKLDVLVNSLKKKNIECIASCLDKKSTILNEYKPKANYHALIFGNESNGINKKDLDKLDNKVYIKISNIDSLNVACAASIFLYQKKIWDLSWKK